MNKSDDVIDGELITDDDDDDKLDGDSELFISDYAQMAF